MLAKIAERINNIEEISLLQEPQPALDVRQYTRRFPAQYLMHDFLHPAWQQDRRELPDEVRLLLQEAVNCQLTRNTRCFLDRQRIDSRIVDKVPLLVNNAAMRGHKGNTVFHAQRIRHALDLLRCIEIIIEKVGQILTVCSFQRAQPILTQRKARIMYIVYARIIGIRPHKFFRTIIAAVVADDDLNVAIRLRERAFQRELEELRPLMRWDEYAHERQRLRRILFEEGSPSRLIGRKTFTKELHERLILTEHGRAQPLATKLQTLRRIEESRSMKEILAPRQVDLRRHEEAVDGEYVLHLAEHPTPGHRTRTFGQPEGTDAPRRMKGDAVGRQELRA